MSNFVTCLAIEEGRFTMVFVAAALVTLLLILVFVVPTLMNSFRSIFGDRQKKIKDAMIGKAETAHVALLSLVVPAMWIALIIAIPFLLWYVYFPPHDTYSVIIDAQGADTLQSIAERYKAQTHVTIKIAPDLKDYRVKGTFKGVCVADLMEEVCRTYSKDLRCSSNYSERTVTIERNVN